MSLSLLSRDLGHRYFFLMKVEEVRRNNEKDIQQSGGDEGDEVDAGMGDEEDICNRNDMQQLGTNGKGNAIDSIHPTPPSLPYTTIACLDNLTKNDLDHLAAILARSVPSKAPFEPTAENSSARAEVDEPPPSLDEPLALVPASPAAGPTMSMNKLLTLPSDGVELDEPPVLFLPTTRIEVNEPAVSIPPLHTSSSPSSDLAVQQISKSPAKCMMGVENFLDLEAEVDSEDEYNEFEDNEDYDFIDNGPSKNLNARYCC